MDLRKGELMRRITGWISILAVVACVAAVATIGVRGQDPDEGAARGRPLAAYRPAVPGIHGLVTAGHPLAAMAGLQILMKGGNAIDAAVAGGAGLYVDGSDIESICSPRLRLVWMRKSCWGGLDRLGLGEPF